MKSFMIATLTAGAFATEIPQISLNLAGTSHVRCEDAAECKHTRTATAKGTTQANSFARRCNVLTDTPATCPSPTASAHDHHDSGLTSQIKVAATQFVVSAPGKKPAEQQGTGSLADGVENQGLAAKYYNNRGEFVLSYNVKDAAGNEAEELVFAMIMVDEVSPVISLVKADATVEACLDKSSANRCTVAGFAGTSASDNYDGTSLQSFTYSVNGGAAKAVAGATITVDAQTVDTHTVKFEATDFADIFGKGNADNVDSTTSTFKVQDTTAPRVYLKPANSGKVAETAACGDELSGVKTAFQCLQHNAKKVIPGFQGVACAGCKGGKCFKAGSNMCTAVEPASTTLECAVAGPTNLFAADGKAKDTGAWGVDDRLSASADHQNNDVDAIKATATGTYDKMKIGTQTFEYSATDGTHTTKKTRTVVVEDTTDVVLKITHLGHKDLNRDTTKNYHAHSPAAAIDTTKLTDPLADLYKIQHSAGYVEDAKYITGLQTAGTGWSCTDTCAGDLTNVAFANKRGSKAEWFKGAGCGLAGSTAVAHPSGFETLTVGSWSLKYTCGDGYQTTTACREIENEDHAKPTITILEGDKDTYEATKKDNYVDAGATCQDEVDGNISQDVEVSGDVVNLARVGTYQIFYNCKDSAGNEADPATRTVIVEDTLCPQCKFTGDGSQQNLEIEASFKFTDNFKTDVLCDDELQASITPVATTFDANNAEYTAEISKTVGTYTIQYVATDSVGNTNAGGNSCKGKQTATDYTRTVVVKDTLKPVIRLELDGTTIKEGSAGASTAADYDASNPLPSTTTTTKTYLMAEETSTTAVNGWVMGAVASAVSGLALLGYSLRKQAQPVATSVPV